MNIIIQIFKTSLINNSMYIRKYIERFVIFVCYFILFDELVIHCTHRYILFQKILKNNIQKVQSDKNIPLVKDIFLKFVIVASSRIESIFCFILFYELVICRTQRCILFQKILKNNIRKAQSNKNITLVKEKDLKY